MSSTAQNSLNADMNSGSSKTLMDWIKIVIFFVIVFGFGYLPPIGPLSVMAMKVLGIFIGLLYGWVVLDFVWTSLVAIVALSMTGYAKIADILAGGFGNNITVFVTLMFVYSAYLASTGLTNTVAYWFLSRKFIVGHPWRLVFMMILATYVITCMTYVYPAMILMWTITYQICKELGYKKGDLFPALLVVGIGIGGTGGYLALPIKSAQALAIGLLQSVSQGQYTLDFVPYVLFMLPLTLIVTVVLPTLIMKYIFRPDVSNLMSITEERFAEHRDKKLSFEEKIGVFSLLIFILLMCIPSVLPADWSFVKLLKNYGMTGSIMVLFIALALVKYQSKPIFNFEKQANSGGISWNAIIMLAACLPIAEAMGSDTLGIMKALMDYITPYFAGMSPFLFCFCVLIAMNLLTQVTHNTVLVVMFTPVFYQLSVMLGINPVMIVIFLVYACNIAMGSPASSAGSALIYLNEWSPQKLTYKFTWINLVFGWVVLLISIPLALFFS